MSSGRQGEIAANTSDASSPSCSESTGKKADDTQDDATQQQASVVKIGSAPGNVEVLVKTEDANTPVVVEADLSYTNLSDSDEGQMQIRLSASSDGSLESDEGEFPTTITSMADQAADAQDLSSTEPATFIPTTFDVDDEDDEAGFTDVSSDAFNSFWKYKKLPKGPKVQQRYLLPLPSTSDPHKPIVFHDPVFDKSLTNTVGHYGKARVGEGNDITPNPKKLVRLGREIEKINQQMSQQTNVNKKEKMKLSSRVCRMKRLANHEANKIKFAGLEQEREELCRLIREIKRMRSTPDVVASGSLTDEIYHTKVAGRTGEYVNSVLDGERVPGASRYMETDSDSDFD